MALLTTQAITRAGTTPTFGAAAAGGDTCHPGDANFLVVKNGGVEVTVTLATPGTVEGLAIADATVTVPASTGEKWIGPLKSELFRNPSDGLVHITYTGVASVTVGVFTL